MGRSGDEPANARSPLRLRAGLAVLGLVSGVGGAVLSWAGDQPKMAVGFAAVGALAVVNLVVVLRHRRQGPHYQPGPDVPPYRPVDPPRRRRRRMPLPRNRVRAYLLIMGTCLALIVLSWVVLPRYSTTAALVVGGVAALLPPLAAVVANAGWRERVARGGDRPEDRRDPDPGRPA